MSKCSYVGLGLATVVLLVAATTVRADRVSTATLFDASGDPSSSASGHASWSSNGSPRFSETTIHVDVTGLSVPDSSSVSVVIFQPPLPFWTQVQLPDITIEAGAGVLDLDTSHGDDVPTIDSGSVIVIYSVDENGNVNDVLLVGTFN